MIALRIEKDQVIFDICKRNLSDIKRSNVLYAHSESFTSFCPVRVFYNYDGGNQAMQRTVKGRIHQTIIRTAFCSPTVDVVVSTRLNWDKFWGYFSKHLHKLCGSLWKCIYIKNCNFFQGSKFNVNVWFSLPCIHVFLLLTSEWRSCFQVFCFAVLMKLIYVRCFGFSGSAPFSCCATETRCSGLQFAT